MRYLSKRMTVTIAINEEHPSASWWRAARGVKRPPSELRPLLSGKATTIQVEPDRARELRAWCAALVGWDPDAAPLTFVGLVGRPPSPRRAAGARRLHVRLAAHEVALLDPLAAARGLTPADLLVTSAVVEAQRAQAIATATSDPDADDGARAEVVSVDVIEIGDAIYTDLRGVPRGQAERVTAVKRETNVWCVELASGPPAWLATGARIWRKRRRART